MTVTFEKTSHDVEASILNDQNALRKVQTRVPEVEWKPTRHELLIIVTLSVCSLLVSLDASIITTSLGSIVSDLQADTTTGFWIGTSYLLVNAISMPVMTSISEIFGRPICLEFALVMFTVGTILCATAQNVGTMLVGRSIQGVGGGGSHVLAGVIITDIVPMRYRPKWFGLILAAWALGTIIGPIIGGGIVEHTTWRWVFYLMFPLCAYGLITVPILLTLKPRTESLKEKLLRVDWVGIALFMGSATSFLIAICWGGTQHPWDSAATIAPLVVGVVGLAATALWEVKFAKEPMFRKTLFHNVSSTVAYICGSAQGFLMWGAFYYIPFYFLSVRQEKPITVGVDLLAGLVILVPASILTGQLVTRFDNYRIAIYIGWSFATLWGILTVVWKYIEVTTAVWVITFLIFGIGHGMVLNAQQFATQAMSKPGDEGHAAGTYTFARQLGAALGVGIGSSAFQNVMALKLQWQGLPVEIAHDAEAYVVKLHAIPDGTPLKDQIIDAYKFGFAGVFQLYLGVAAVALILSLLFTKHYTLNRSLGSEHVLKDNRASKAFVGDSKSRLASAASSRAALNTTSGWSSTDQVNATDAADPVAPRNLMADPGWPLPNVSAPERVYRLFPNQTQNGMRSPISPDEMSPPPVVVADDGVNNGFNPYRYPTYTSNRNMYDYFGQPQSKLPSYSNQTQQQSGGQRQQWL